MTRLMSGFLKSLEGIMKHHLPKRWPELVLFSILMTALPWISAGAEPATFAKPEKARLEVGTAGSGTTSLPLLVAQEAGYFAKHGLNVSINQVGATVDPAALRVVLEDSSDPKAKSADPKRFYDNFLIEGVNRDYASKLFPGEVR